jgi:hypothetical protein
MKSKFEKPLNQMWFLVGIPARGTLTATLSANGTNGWIRRTSTEQESTIAASLHQFALVMFHLGHQVRSSLSDRSHHS